MTHNQIEYAKYVEQKRHNIQDETIGYGNLAVQERSQQELVRHNFADESIRRESNVINNAHYLRQDAASQMQAQAAWEQAQAAKETAAANTRNAESNAINAQAALISAGAAVSQANAALQNATTNVKTQSVEQHYKAAMVVQYKKELAENKRHNKATEANTKRGQDTKLIGDVLSTLSKIAAFK